MGLTTLFSLITSALTILFSLISSALATDQLLDSPSKNRCTFGSSQHSTTPFAFSGDTQEKFEFHAPASTEGFSFDALPTKFEFCTGKTHTSGRKQKDRKPKAARKPKIVFGSRIQHEPTLAKLQSDWLVLNRTPLPDADCVDSLGNTILHRAAIDDSISCERFSCLVKQNQHLMNQTNGIEQTALHVLVFHHLKSEFKAKCKIEMLIDHGADATLPDRYGRSPIALAECLIKNRCKLDSIKRMLSTESDMSFFLDQQSGILTTRCSIDDEDALQNILLKIDHRKSYDRVIQRSVSRTIKNAFEKMTDGQYMLLFNPLLPKWIAVVLQAIVKRAPRPEDVYAWVTKTGYSQVEGFPVCTWWRDLALVNKACYEVTRTGAHSATDILQFVIVNYFSKILVLDLLMYCNRADFGIKDSDLTNMQIGNWFLQFKAYIQRCIDDFDGTLKKVADDNYYRAERFRALKQMKFPMVKIIDVIIKRLLFNWAVNASVRKAGRTRRVLKAKRTLLQ